MFFLLVCRRGIEYVDCILSKKVRLHPKTDSFCRWGLEYVDCIPGREVRPPAKSKLTRAVGLTRRWLYPQQRGKNTPITDVLIMTVNCMKRWGYCYGTPKLWSTTLLPLLPSLLRPKILIPVRVRNKSVEIFFCIWWNCAWRKEKQIKKNSQDTTTRKI